MNIKGGADTVDTTCFALFTLGLFVAVVAGGLLLYAVVATTACDGRWSEYEHEWSIMGGCRVLTEYGYLPEDNIRMTIDDVTFVVPAS